MCVEIFLPFNDFISFFHYFRFKAVAAKSKVDLVSEGFTEFTIEDFHNTVSVLFTSSLSWCRCTREHQWTFLTFSRCFNGTVRTTVTRTDVLVLDRESCCEVNQKSLTIFVSCNGRCLQTCSTWRSLKQLGVCIDNLVTLYRTGRYDVLWYNDKDCSLWLLELTVEKKG